MASIVKEVCKHLNTWRLHTTTYHPQTDGLVERSNGTLAEKLSMYISMNQKDWDKHLLLVLLYTTFLSMPLQESHHSTYCTDWNHTYLLIWPLFCLIQMY